MLRAIGSIELLLLHFIAPAAISNGLSASHSRAVAGGYDRLWGTSTDQQPAHCFCLFSDFSDRTKPEY